MNDDPTPTRALRAVRFEVEIPAPGPIVYRAWTTPEGVAAFFCERASIDPRPGGPYELYFIEEAPPGTRGSEGCHFLALREPDFISFTWNNPPTIPDCRPHYTAVTIELTEVSPEVTRVDFANVGFPEGGPWDDAFAYFQGAWIRVLDSLEHAARSKLLPGMG